MRSTARTTAKQTHQAVALGQLNVSKMVVGLAQVDHELVMVGCDYYTPTGSTESIPVYIVKNQWGTGVNGACCTLRGISHHLHEMKLQ